MSRVSYDEALRRLDTLQRRDPDPGPETTAALLDDLGNPHRDLTCVQIAGTNGKGSTARTLSNILEAAGFNVGLFTSPSLGGIRDQIRVGGCPISEQAIARFVEAAWPHVERRPEDATPTFFEALAALALWAFEREVVDIAVLEAGMGGGMDATSAVDPVLSAVTSVSREHVDVLGETRLEIARELGRVAPSDAPLVTGATGRAREVLGECTDVRTVGISSRRCARPPDIAVSEIPCDDATTSTFSLVGPDWSVTAESPMLGRHQAVNAGVAATLSRQLAAVPVDAIVTGIQATSVPGRFELLGTDPIVALDGAHNSAACQAIASLLDRFDYNDCLLVFGVMEDKDYAEMWAALPTPTRVSFVRADTSRAASPERLADAVDANQAAIRTTKTVEDGLEAEIRSAKSGDLVLVTGSLALVAQARDHLTRDGKGPYRTTK